MKLERRAYVESGRLPVCTPRVVSVSGRLRLSRFHWPDMVGRNMNASSLIVGWG